MILTCHPKVNVVPVVVMFGAIVEQVPTRIATCANLAVERLVASATSFAVVVLFLGLVVVVIGLGRAVVPVSKVVSPQTSSRASYPKYKHRQSNYPK